MKFENGVAVVTGGAGRIGRETARMFCEEGVAVALCDISAEGVEKVAAELREKGYNCKGYVMDVCSTESVNAAAAKIYADFEKVDILVNNAGRWKCTIFDDMTEEQWIDTINLNLHGVFRVTKAFLSGMLEQKYGRIINLTSIAGEVGLPKFCDYAASKGGLIMMTKTLAMEYGKRNVTFNCVSPGLIMDSWDGNPCKLTWVERPGFGDEIARAIVFLAEDTASFITGADLTVDGGRILGPRFCDM